MVERKQNKIDLCPFLLFSEKLSLQVNTEDGRSKSLREIIGELAGKGKY